MTTAQPFLAAAHRRRCAIVLVATIAAALAHCPRVYADGGDDLAGFTHLDQLELSNGLDVILRADHRAPFVSLSIWYNVGSRDDPPGLEGLSHVFEHLMFEGSAHVPGGHKQWLHRLKAYSANAQTMLDRTIYFETFPAANLEGALWLESDRMGFVDRIDDAALDRARAAVRHERGEKVDNRAYAAATQRFQEALFPAPHPYGRPSNGDDRRLDAIRLDDVRAFRAKWYSPANACLVLVGDFDPAQAGVLVRRYFEGLPSAPRPSPPALHLPPLDHEVVIHEPERFGNLTTVSVGWRSPAFFAPGDAAGDILAHLLTGGRSSRLGRRLDQEQRLTVTTRAHQTSHPAVSEFAILLVLQPGVEPRRALAALDEELADLAERGPTREELLAAQVRQELRLVGRLDGVRGLERIADLIQLYQHAIGEPNGILRDRERYRAVTADDVRQFVRDHLRRDRRVVVIADPIAGARAGQPSVLPDESESDK